MAHFTQLLFRHDQQMQLLPRTVAGFPALNTIRGTRQSHFIQVKHLSYRAQHTAHSKAILHISWALEAWLQLNSKYFWLSTIKREGLIDSRKNSR